MAFDKDAFMTALDGMSVLELNELVKAIEEKFGVSAASMAAPAAGGGAAAPAAAEQTEFTVILSCRRRQGERDQGSTHDHWPGLERSQGPG